MAISALSMYPENPSSRAARRFLAGLTAFLLLLLATTRAEKAGDFIEYGVTAVALAQHGTPDVRAADAGLAMRYSPEAGIARVFKDLGDGIARGDTTPLPGFERAPSGATYSIHFFAYPLLAALPLRALQAVGADPFKAFQVVNYAALGILALALFRLFGASRRAAAAFILVLAAGGILYANWCSPEMMSAALLLSGIVLFTTGRPVSGGVLAGVAAMQNPSIVCFAVFAPLLAVVDPAGWRGTTRPDWRRLLAGGAIAAVMASLPFLFFLWQFGTPSLIARYSTDRQLVGIARLASYYLDLNQGMVIGLAAVPLLLLAPAAWRRGRQSAAALALTLAFMLGLAVPTLSTTNWNSGAHGMMRYALWGSTPLLYLVFARWRNVAQWPVRLLAVVFVLQAGAMWHARQYSPKEFSPLAQAVMHRAPASYNPDPDIFYKRANHTDAGPDPRRIARWPAQGPIDKAMFYAGNANAGSLLCGPGRLPLALGIGRDAGGGWRYVDGPVKCEAARATAAAANAGGR